MTPSAVASVRAVRCPNYPRIAVRRAVSVNDRIARQMMRFVGDSVPAVKCLTYPMAVGLQGAIAMVLSRLMTVSSPAVPAVTVMRATKERIVSVVPAVRQTRPVASPARQNVHRTMPFVDASAPTEICPNYPMAARPRAVNAVPPSARPMTPCVTASARPVSGRFCPMDADRRGAIVKSPRSAPLTMSSAAASATVPNYHHYLTVVAHQGVIAVPIPSVRPMTPSAPVSATVRNYHRYPTVADHLAATARHRRSARPMTPYVTGSVSAASCRTYRTDVDRHAATAKWHPNVRPMTPSAVVSVRPAICPSYPKAVDHRAASVTHRSVPLTTPSVDVSAPAGTCPTYPRAADRRAVSATPRSAPRTMRSVIDFALPATRPIYPMVADHRAAYATLRNARQMTPSVVVSVTVG